ncbi:winged helix-turn-helix domain-containing protein [Serratia sp. JSRIV001]|uniref:winged helix-turn-helix domain-containing protein n=1 Tax=Serratia sp. JSRIV001 TaxID=2831893 RepID=UPI001CBED088|nr:winged helix-turn-helix domain-containing protein [Serratia sp. JSRIV001]UAN45362.1 winged helix-turn-helix domain-containing protein [Serratia sp. JSRIV001]
MKYVINEVIVYNSADGTLLAVDQTMGIITLTRVTSELLLMLLENNNQPLSRDVILSELWEKKGLSSSSNNLNNYVSMLRKALAQCGCIDSITTVPKYGFMFTAEVRLITATENTKEIVPTTESEEQKKPSSPAVTEKKRHVINALRQKKIKITVFIFSFFLIIHSPWIYNYIRLNSIRDEVFRYKQCRFYLADYLTKTLPISSTIKTIKLAVNNNKLNCDDEANIYYFVQNKQDSYGRKTISNLLAYCPFNKRISCSNYYVNEYEDKNEKKH